MVGDGWGGGGEGVGGRRRLSCHCCCWWRCRLAAAAAAAANAADDAAAKENGTMNYPKLKIPEILCLFRWRQGNGQKRHLSPSRHAGP